MSQATETRIRTLVAGDLLGEWYQLTLDGNESVYTKDETIATTAARAKRAGQGFTVETEKQADGRPVITELNVVVEQKAASATAAVATRQASGTSAPAGATALAKSPTLPSGLISDPLQLTEQLHAMEKHYHVMSPAISISQMAQGYGANLAVVKIDPTVVMNDRDQRGARIEPKSGSGPDCYWSKSIHGADTNKRSLRKEGLLKLSQAAGIQWLPQYCRRVDNGKDPYFWRWQYYGLVRTHDGGWQPLPGSKELDLRDGSASARACASPQHLAKARENGNEVCETKAMLRAIRAMRVQQVFTVQELEKPFLIVRFSFMPDMNDPEIKKMVTQQAMSGIASLYGPATSGALPALPEPTFDDDDDDDDEAATDTAAAPAKTNPFADDASDAPVDTLPDGTTTIAEVRREKGVNANTKRPWARFDVTFANGQVTSTFNTTLHQLIDDAFRQKSPVRIETSEREGYNDNLDKLEIVDSRQQKLPADGGY